VSPPLAPDARRRLRGELLLLFLTLLWGSSFVIIKRIELQVSAGSLVFLRFGIAAALFAPFLRRDARLWLAGLEIGLWLWGGFLTQAIGIRYTTVGRSAFVTSLNVIFVPMLAAVVGRRVGMVIWLAAALAFGGAALLCYDGSPANRGDLWMLLCAVLFAVCIVRLESGAARFPALPLTAVQLLAVCGLSIPWFARDLIVRPPVIPWGGVLYLAVVCTALTTWLQTVGQRDVPAPQASIIYMMESIFASGFAYLQLGDRMGWRGWAGSATILSATLLSQVPLFKRRRPLSATKSPPISVGGL
jgi:drug/metabolite transporter (DMT)-like permease